MMGLVGTKKPAARIHVYKCNRCGQVTDTRAEMQLVLRRCACGGVKIDTDSQSGYLKRDW